MVLPHLVPPNGLYPTWYYPNWYPPMGSTPTGISPFSVNSYEARFDRSVVKQLLSNQDPTPLSVFDSARSILNQAEDHL
ncbi:hypothetical protein Ddc_21268 [Ditylenchus destructor]|nr:hypothetical protein Ddc_21268 [Ditylenchus destructor]